MRMCFWEQFFSTSSRRRASASEFWRIHWGGEVGPAWMCVWAHPQILVDVPVSQSFWRIHWGGEICPTWICVWEQVFSTNLCWRASSIVLKCWLKWQILSHLDVRLRTGVVHKFSSMCQCPRFWNNFPRKFFNKMMMCLFHRMPPTHQLLWFCKIAPMLLLFPFLSVSLMCQSLKIFKMSLCVLYRKVAKPRSVTSGYPPLETSCFLMSGLSRTWCISLGTGATRTKFALFASSRITTYIQMKSENARDATDWRWVMPSCVLTTSQRLHPILSAFTEGPTACFMDGIPIGIWIPVAVCDCGLEWRWPKFWSTIMTLMPSPLGTSGSYDGERRMEQRWSAPPTLPASAGCPGCFPNTGHRATTYVVESVYESILARVETTAVPCASVLEGFVAVWLPRPALQALTDASRTRLWRIWHEA